MKRKIIIRINRNNEINWGWVFLIFCQAILFIVMLKVNNISQVLLVLFGLLIIGASALLYQGFEVVKG